MERNLFARDVIFSQLEDLFELSKIKDKEFKCRIKDLPSIRKEFLTLQGEIEKGFFKAKTIDKDEQLKQRKRFSDLYYSIQIVVDEIKISEPRLVHAPSSIHDCCTSNNIKLPHLPLPTFSGNVTDFNSYFDLFTSLVHANVNLSDIEKFRYLLLSLKGEPLNLIKSIPVTSENYAGAIEILSSRYNNQRIIASKHMDKILDIEPFTGKNNQTLRNILNIYYENVTALKMMKFPVHEWSFVLLQILLRKIGAEVRRRFELSLTTPSDIPKVSELVDFLQKELSASEIMQSSDTQTERERATTKRTNPPPPPPKRAVEASLCAGVSKPNKKCPCCNSTTHFIVSKCSEFLQLTPQARFDIVKQKNLCINCLIFGHSGDVCKSSFSCRTCSKHHHTLLHFPTRGDHGVSPHPSMLPNACTTSPADSVNALTSLASSGPSGGAATARASAGCRTSLLSTALVDVHVHDKTYTLRCIVDSGSQTSIVTGVCAQRLGLPHRRLLAPLCGVGDGEALETKGEVSFYVTPRNKLTPKFYVDAVVMNKITGDMPNFKLANAAWPHIQNLELADPYYFQTRPVDLLLGADIFSEIMLGTKVTGPPGTPAAFGSSFGFLLIGKTELVSSTPTYTCLGSFERKMDLERFWEVEEISSTPPVSAEDSLCETIFVETHSRDSTGKFVVRLPLKLDAPALGDSRGAALSRLRQLEYRLSRNPTLKLAYHKCLQEYMDLNHMEIIEDPTQSTTVPYYIPHTCVIKQSSTTSPLRVVFDASCKTSSGTSLNDILLVGPKLQQDIVAVILKFRLHFVVFTADIKQMYRQILIHPEQQDLQRILWRTDPAQPVREYRLRTVTFGVSAAPFLAIRALRQLAFDEISRWPHAARVLLSDIFVDDVVTGADSITAALELKKELNELCAAGCFELRKWTSNHEELVSLDSPMIPRDSNGEREPLVTRETISFADLDGDTSVKVLGLEWNPQSDCFRYSIKPLERQCTKRAILSEIARIYDPLGWLAPVVLFAKHFIQRLWLSGTDWDEIPPVEVVKAWKLFLSELPLLSDISLPRHILPTHDSVQLVGFADASEKAYAGVVYLRTSDSIGVIQVHLLIAKTKVAPLKRISIPRLELNGALLLAKLIESVQNIFTNLVNFDNIFVFSDSSTVLAWLSSSPHNWKTFVANRVTEIQKRIPSSCWRHVRSSDNPADVASRGALPSALIDHPLWFSGPAWLKDAPDTWPNVVSCSTEEEKRLLVLNSTTQDYCDLFNRFSTLGRLLRVTAYILRFLKLSSKTENKNVSVPELQSALKYLIKIVQSTVFGDDIENLQKGKPCSTRLQRLKPFIDSDGLLRVGGRIDRSRSLNFEAKHQLILPKEHPLTTLIIDDAHRVHLHPGPQALQYLLLQRFWILSARDIVRQRTHRCVRCFRCRPTSPQPEMASLPAARLNQIRPFIKVGVDFAGPFLTRANKVRNAKVIKSYICLFICMATRAVHLEIVSDLSTDAFLATLRRFCSRRGLCTDIYSDNGKNFVGTDKRLKEFYQFLNDTKVNDCIISNGLAQGISWHFSPAYGSHFGGLWEAGVKSTKHHLHRVVGTQILTYDEFHTLLCQIEAMLNSRPLCVLSTDPSDPLPLTPSHFLIGGPLVSLPDMDFYDQVPNRLTRWQLIQQCSQHFWRRWSMEYLHGLQQRGKWIRPDSKAPLTEGTVVLVKDDNLPPLQWRLGLVHATHPGSDGVVRVVTLRLGNHLVKRPAVKVCPLPIA